jgi:hypothetical protein
LAAILRYGSHEYVRSSLSKAVRASCAVVALALGRVSARLCAAGRSSPCRCFDRFGIPPQMVEPRVRPHPLPVTGKAARFPPQSGLASPIPEVP